MRLQNMLQNFEKTYANGIPCAINEVIDHENYINDSYKMKRKLIMEK